MNKIKIKKKKIKIKNKNLLPIYYCKPKNFSSFKKKKIILVIEEIFGVNNNIKNICKKIAKKKYLSIAPELLYKIKNINFKKNINKLRDIVNTISDNEVINNIDNLVKWVKKKYKTNNIGITGFCWGGRITWLYSYFNKNKIKTSVIWYGRILDIKNNKHPIHPIDIIDKINIPILGLYGEKDKSIPLSTVNKIIKKIKKNNLDIKIIIYKNAEHGFFADYRPTYNKKIAKKSWKKMISWFKKKI